MSAIYYIPLEEIRRIRSLNTKPIKKVALFANVCRLNCLYMIAQAGSGHIGSSFSSMDILSWLFLQELKDDDIYFSSKGHDVPGLYSVLLATEKLPFKKIHTLRRLGGLPGHPDVETPYMVTNTGPLGMGISKAKGMIYAKNLLGKKGRIFVLTGDGELQEGQFWESLQPTANKKINNITAIIDHNKIQSDTWVSDVSDLGNLEARLKSYDWEVSRVNGNDVPAFAKTLAKIQETKNKPKVIIADTVKGKGVSFMEKFDKGDPLYKFHSGAPDAQTYTRAYEELLGKINSSLKELGQLAIQVETVEKVYAQKSTTAQKMVGAYAEALVKQGERNKKIVALDADLVLDCGLIPFREKFPDRFYECGIAEQDMVSQAGGMALQGLLPIVHSFACFLSTRPNEQIYNNATEQTKIIYVGSLAGLTPAGPGHSHQSVRDISALSANPGMVLIEPCHEIEVELALDYCVNKTKESSYIRLVTIPCEIPYAYKETALVEGQGQILKEGKDAIVFGYGPVLLPEIWKASQSLEKQGINLKIINLPWLNRIDENWLKETVKDFDWVLTLDNHYIKGGQGEFIASRLPQIGLAKIPQVKHFGVTEIPKCGTNDEVLKAHQLDANSLTQSVSGLFSLINS